MTLHEAASDWLAGARAGVVRSARRRVYKPSTLRGYERALRMRVLPALGHMKFSEIRRRDVQDFADRLLADGHDPSTILNTLDPLRAIFRYAIQRDRIAASPCVNLDIPMPEGTRDRIASPEEARALLAALRELDRALWATAFYAGLRRGELRGLRWSDVDLLAGEIHVRRAWDDNEGAIEGKSKAAHRTVPIMAVLAPSLVNQRRYTGNGELVFAIDGKPFVPSTVRRRALAAWDGMAPITLHEARHTFASILIAAGVNAKAITDFMGHSTIQMSFDRYGHLLPGGRDEARRRVDDYLGRPDDQAHQG